MIKEGGCGVGRELKVHITGQPSDDDEWIAVVDGRVRKVDCADDESEEESVDEAQEVDEQADPVQQAAAAAASAHLTVGSRMEARDSTGNWYASKVIDEQYEGLSRELKVHFKGW